MLRYMLLIAPVQSTSYFLSIGQRSHGVWFVESRVSVRALSSSFRHLTESFLDDEGNPLVSHLHLKKALLAYKDGELDGPGVALVAKAIKMQFS